MRMVIVRGESIGYAIRREKMTIDGAKQTRSTLQVCNHRGSLSDVAAIIRVPATRRGLIQLEIDGKKLGIPHQNIADAVRYNADTLRSIANGGL